MLVHKLFEEEKIDLPFIKEIALDPDYDREYWRECLILARNVWHKEFSSLSKLQQKRITMIVEDCAEKRITGSISKR